MTGLSCRLCASQLRSIFINIQVAAFFSFIQGHHKCQFTGANDSVCYLLMLVLAGIAQFIGYLQKYIQIVDEDLNVRSAWVKTNGYLSEKLVTNTSPRDITERAKELPSRVAD